MNGQVSGVETTKANDVSAEIRSILNALDRSEFVHAQENLSRRLDKIHAELGKMEIRAWLGSEPRLHVERMLDEIIGERLDAHLRSIHDALHELCVQMLANSREIRTMMTRLTEISSGTPVEESPKDEAPSARKYGILAELSAREREVVEHLLSGKMNREIAERLGISERTVKNHLWRIYKKVGVENRSQLFSMLAIL